VKLPILLTAAILWVGSAAQAASVYRIASTDAESVMQKWLAAQNTGNFKAYEQLYADRFTGIRRSGTRVVPMNRAKWLADREKMFRRPMKVTASGLAIVPGNENAVITFTQTWESNTYKDKGPKQIIVIRDPSGQLRISQEAMLESLISFHDPEMKTDSIPFTHLLSGFVLLPEEPQKEWTNAAPTLIPRDGLVASAVADVKPSGLPEHAKHWKGHTVRLYAGNGPVCTGTVTNLKILSAMVPHFGQSQRWIGSDGVEIDSAKKMPDEAIAKEIFEGGGRYLVGEVKATEGDCSKAEWARSASLSSANGLSEVSNGKIKEFLLSQFRLMPQYRASAKAGGFTGDTPWDDPERTEIHVFKSANGTYFSVGSEAGNFCSSDAAAAFTAIGKLEGTEAKPTIKWLGTFDALYSIKGAIDIAEDKSPWLLYGTFPSTQGILRVQNGTYKPLYDVAVPYHDCPC